MIVNAWNENLGDLTVAKRKENYKKPKTKTITDRNTI